MEKGLVIYNDHSPSISICLGHLSIVPAWFSGRTPILARCLSHQYWPGAIHTNSGLVPYALILARCCPQQFWIGAIRNKSGSVPFALILPWCHFNCTNSGPVQLTFKPSRCSLPLGAGLIPKQMHDDMNDWIPVYQ